MRDASKNGLQPLRDVQAEASAPTDHVWLSASAGTGKTHVLTARVFRLLLRRVNPESILCLTFTKAGAAEMAERIHNRLAEWVQMDDNQLFHDLEALGEASGPEARDYARTLFARVLDASGAGLRIQTIHSFCQGLLSAFPVEADLIPGFRALEDREQKALARAALADMLVNAEEHGDTRLMCAIQVLSLRMGEDKAEGFLNRCAKSYDSLAGLGEDIRGWVFETLDLPDGDVEAMIAEKCRDDVFDMQSLARIASANAAWGVATGLKHADLIAQWRAANIETRATTLDSVLSVVCTGKGELRKFSPKLVDAEPDYPELAARIADSCSELLNLRAQVAYADLIAQGLYAGRAYAMAYAEAKRHAGAVDFDDLIARTVELLTVTDMAEWIRYKLDQSTDHVLVDEAQDTNISQWQIIGSLVSEFFAGLGAKDDKVRTLFVVGDFKQAIYGFQGTSPQSYALAGKAFARRAEEAEHHIAQLTLNESFRSTPPVLEVVDRVIEQLGSEALGLEPADIWHDSALAFPGEVILLNPVSADSADADDDSEEIEDQAGDEEEGWLDDHVLAFAARLAKQVKKWTDGSVMLESQGRPLGPGDVMILVRSRTDLARLIVARLYEEGVHVAGVDRLRLNAPLAVQDMLAALRFVLQPEDDLNLANLLVSPLLGWSQEDLLEHGLREKGVGLWSHLRAHLGDDARIEPLRELLRHADLTTPYRYLEQILSGPLDGRRKLLLRLGKEARDPIEELLNAALAFEGESHPSLQRFIDWFDRGDVDIKRESGGQGDAVRVLTVHGAKGLQAPMVILADATYDPKKKTGLNNWLDWPQEDGGALPVVRPRKAERFGPFTQAADDVARAEMEEHWRLLYVAMTRAEEKLVVGGALSNRAKGDAPQLSWYRAIANAMGSLGAVAEEAAIWNGQMAWRGHQLLQPKPQETDSAKVAVAGVTLPDWITQPAPQEARPPRPLAPSAAEEDTTPDPPPGVDMRAAAERGKWLHSLYERLPAVPPAERRAAAERWLMTTARVTDDVQRSEILASALSIIDDSRFAEIFSSDALAEAPIAAIVGEQVIAGTVDRLRITDDMVEVVDFKTGRMVPASADTVPLPHLRQMAAYAAALSVIFPGHRVVARLLYTHGPQMISLPEELLAAHKPGFAMAQDNL